MSFIDRLFNRQKAIEPGDKFPDWALSTAESQRHEIPDLNMPDKQSSLMLKLAWVNAAVGAVARSTALQGLDVYNLQGEKRRDVENHPFEQLLRRPNPLQSRYEFLYAIAAWVKLTGNCYIWLNRTSVAQPPSEMWILPTSQVKPVPDGNLYLRGYTYDPGNGQTIPLDTWQVSHVKNFHPSNAFVGASDIEALATAAETDWHMGRWNSNLFDKDNAKFPGALLFADFIPDEQWNKMQRDFKSQQGGTQRALRMLRGVGAGGVQWLQTTMSQSDMEFLAGRTFTRDEIYSVLAPGLQNITSTNATMANAEAGKRTFTELAIWPLCVAIHERITLDILPAYGDNLICEFEDPRVTDRVLELQERSAWDKVHTVKESRDKWDGDTPLGDERDDLLVPQVDKLGDKAIPPEPQPIPAGLLPFAGQDNAHAEDDSQEEPSPPEDDNTTLDQARQAEMGKWRRYATRHGADKARTFNTEFLPGDVEEVIKSRLALAESDQEVKAAFSGPFLVKADRVTAGGVADPAGPFKDSAERRIARLLKSRLNGQLNEVMRLLGDPPDINNLSPEFWETQAGQLIGDLRPELTRLAASMAEDEIAAGIGIGWDVVNDGAADWATSYTYDLVRGLNDTTRRAIGKGLDRYFREPTQIGALRQELEPWFGQVRANMIAVTEVTRAAAEGERIVGQAAAQAGIKLEPVWNTSQDELVCSICGPNDGKAKSQGWTVDWAPAHPNCRCWITHRYVANG